MSVFASCGSEIRLLKYEGRFVIQKKIGVNNEYDKYIIKKSNNEVLFYEEVACLFNEENRKYLVRYFGCKSGILLEYHNDDKKDILESIDMIVSIHLQFWNNIQCLFEKGLKIGHFELEDSNNLVQIYNEFESKVDLSQDELQICREIISNYKKGYYNITPDDDLTLSHGNYWNKNILKLKIIDWQYVNINRCTDDLVLFILDNYDPNNVEGTTFIKEYYYFKLQYSRNKFESNFKKSILIPFLFSIIIKLMQLNNSIPTNNNPNLFTNFIHFYKNFITP